MKPQEKAKEIFDKMFAELGAEESSEMYKMTMMLCAKRCSLIAVDEIIAEEESHWHNTDWWQEVRKEIVKMGM